MAYTIELKDRGYQVIECIDLFDEARYGADKLFFRKCCQTVDEVKEQITYALSSEQAPQGGNPLAQVNEKGEPIIALNRYHIPNKKFWNNTPPLKTFVYDDGSVERISVANPYKASAAVTFSIRVHFRDDFAYINFGCPWSAVMDEEDDETSDEIISDMSKFALLSCHFISKDDALTILKDIVGEVVVANTLAKNLPKPKIVQEVLELTDEDGSIISL